MADDSGRVVFPDELDEIKEADAKSKVDVDAGNSNSVEESPENPSVTSRNMITAPANCPAGYQMGSDGVCRQVFD